MVGEVVGEVWARLREDSDSALSHISNNNNNIKHTTHMQNRRI